MFGAFQPFTYIWRIVHCSARSKGGAAHEMCEVWTEPAGRSCACHSVAVHAGLRFEHAATSRDTRILIPRTMLIFHPCRELFRRIDIDAKQHLRMLDSAKLRALPEV